MSAPILRLSTWQKLVFLVNSRLGLFTAAPFSKGLPFSLTYGVILPSSLTKVLPLVLGFSPHLPVSVYGTGDMLLDSGFSWQCGVVSFSTCFRSASHFSFLKMGICLHLHLCACTPHQLGAPTILLRPHLLSYASYRYRNFHLLSIDYAFQPRLRSRLTLSGRALLRNPWVFDGWDSHSPFATYASILSSMKSTMAFAFCFFSHTLLLYHLYFHINPQLRYIV